MIFIVLSLKKINHQSKLFNIEQRRSDEIGDEIIYSHTDRYVFVSWHSFYSNSLECIKFIMNNNKGTHTIRYS